MKIRKIYNYIFILIFLLGISLPWIFSDKDGGKISVNENRVLAKLPNLTINGQFNPDYKNQFETWLNDNLGLKNKFIAANRFVEMNLFNRFTEKNMTKGKDGWKYLTSDIEIKNAQNNNIPSETTLSNIEKGLTDITSFLKKRNCAYVSMVWPNKVTAYPENFPNYFNKLSDKAEIEILDERLSNNPNFDFSTGSKAIEQAKKNNVIYSKARDASHWNDYGAFVGYTQLMNKAKEHLPELKVLKESDFNIIKTEIQVPLAWNTNTPETIFDLQLKQERNAVLDQSFFEKINFTTNDITRNYYHYVNKDKSLPKAIIIGDSYTWMFMLPNIAESFSEIVFIHYYDMINFESMVDLIKPNIVISSCLDPHITEMVNFKPMSEVKVDHDIQALPVKHLDKNTSTFWIDYFDATWKQGNIYVVDKNKKILKLDGWAIDVLSGHTAKEVIIQIGNEFIYADYGGPKQSVADRFSDQNYVNSGLTIKLDTDKIVAAGGFTIHIIGKDGSYRYDPISYSLER